MFPALRTKVRQQKRPTSRQDSRRNWSKSTLSQRSNTRAKRVNLRTLRKAKRPLPLQYRQDNVQLLYEGHKTYPRVITKTRPKVTMPTSRKATASIRAMRRQGRTIPSRRHGERVLGGRVGPFRGFWPGVSVKGGLLACGQVIGAVIVVARALVYNKLFKLFCD